MIDDQHVRDDDLERYIGGQLEPQTISAMDAHLSECAACRDSISRILGFRLVRATARVLHPRTKERRSEPRFTTGEEAIAQELHPLSLERQKVQITNVSRNGLGLLSRKFVSPGTILQLRTDQIIRFGEVRHCLEHSEENFYVGLKLQRER
jgi:hypothetical protein